MSQEFQLGGIVPWGRSAAEYEAFLYAQASQRIAAGFETTSERMLQGMRAAHERFDWTYYGSPKKWSSAGETRCEPSLPT